MRSIREDAERWLYFLRELGEARLPNVRLHVTLTAEDIYLALSYDTIDDVARASMRGCTECERRASKPVADLE